MKKNSRVYNLRQQLLEPRLRDINLDTPLNEVVDIIVGNVMHEVERQLRTPVGS
jgi:hypothetical protein